MQKAGLAATNTSFNGFPFNNFTYYFTLFSKFFSSFGSQQPCSYSNLSKNIQIGRWCIPCGNPTCIRFHYAHGFGHPGTRTTVRLLGPCFQTGRLKPFRQHPARVGSTPAQWRPPASDLHAVQPTGRHQGQGTPPRGTRGNSSVPADK